MGESGDIFFPKLDEEKDMIPFDRIALDLLKELGLEADICDTEQEAKEKAAQIAASPSRSLAQLHPACPAFDGAIAVPPFRGLYLVLI